jgi:hypothetical protein
MKQPKKFNTHNTVRLLKEENFLRIALLRRDIHITNKLKL